MIADRTEALVQAIVERARTERVPPSHIVDREFIRGTEKTTIEDAARVGLVRLANDHLHRLRNGGGGGERTRESERVGDTPVRQPGKPHPKDWRQLFDRIMLVTPDGERLAPIHEIGVDDLESLTRDYRSKAEAYQRRGCALSEAVTILRDRHLDTIAELPMGDQAKLSSIFAKAWGP